jgi:hypothetical protein
MKLSPEWIAPVKRTAFFLVGFATLVAVGIAVENWRGRRAWAALETNLRTRGLATSLEPPALPPIADAENFFKHPLVDTALFEAKPGSRLARQRTEFGLDRYARVLWAVRTPVSELDLPAIRAALIKEEFLTSDSPGEDPTAILAGLRQVAPVLDALGEATRQRRRGWLPPYTWSGSPLSADQTVAVSNLLGVRAAVFLADGKSDLACADALALLGVGRIASERATNLLESLVGLHLCTKAIEVLAAGSRQHRWQHTHLEALQRELAGLRPVHWTREMFAHERVLISQLLGGSNPKELSEVMPFWFLPGWVQQNRVTHWQYLEQVIATFDPQSEQALAEPLAALRRAEQTIRSSRSPYFHITRLAVANLHPIVGGVCASINSLRLAITACALECFYLDQGRYPEDLAPLAPTLLPRPPRDVLTGKPIQYKVTPSGFILTASGANENSPTELRVEASGDRN